MASEQKTARSLFDVDDNDRITAERMADPQPGDRFHEMYSFWVEVIDREGDVVVSRDSSDRRWRPRSDTVEEFRTRFAYGSIPGYWVAYYDRALPIRGVPRNPARRARWLAILESRRWARMVRPSMDSAML